MKRKPVSLKALAWTLGLSFCALVALCAWLGYNPNAKPAHVELNDLACVAIAFICYLALAEWWRNGRRIGK